MMRRTVVALFAGLAAATLAMAAPGAAQSRPWGEGYFPNLPVVTQDGKTLRFYDDVIKGKIVVVNFIYTNCPDICGLTTARLLQAHSLLELRLAPRRLTDEIAAFLDECWRPQAAPARAQAS